MLQALWMLVAPELVMVCTGLLCLFLGIILPQEQKHKIGYLAQTGIIIALGITLALWNRPGSILDGVYRVDTYALFIKATFLIALALVVQGCFGCVNRVRKIGEYYFLLLMATTGMSVLVSAGEYITFFIGLETVTVTFVLLTCIRHRERKDVEGGLKYIILGSLAAALLLYGLSFLYGCQGHTLIAAPAAWPIQQWHPILMLALALIIGGLGFKCAIVPFHMWAPDVYEAAPAPVVGYLASGAKAACFAALARLLAPFFGDLWSRPAELIAILAAITMVAGNLMAIPQTNIKRLLAYSSIAQAGYILTGLVQPSSGGLKATLIYLFLYLFAVVPAFVVVAFWRRVTDSNDIQAFAGMGRRAPLPAAVLLVAMLSMAGIPPFAGFVGKFYLFISVAESHLWLAYTGFIMSVVSVYYYLRVALVMYRDEPAEASAPNQPIGMRAVLLTALAATLFIGIYPGPLAELVNGVVVAFMHSVP